MKHIKRLVHSLCKPL